MNPKISISIDNNKAAAVLTGMFTVGAKVDVEVTGLPDGIPNWGADDKFTGKSLRFRIVDACGKDLARFPLVEKGTGTDGDTWTVDAETGKYSTTSGCVFNMDTDKLRAAFAKMPFNAKLEFGMVFDSIVDAAQYAIGRVRVSQWSASSEEDPTVLPDWRETLAKLDADLEQVEDAKSDAETAAAAAQVAQSAAQTSAVNAAASAASAASSADRVKGVPVGGTTGQVLKKRSGTDYDVEWSSGGGGTSDYGDLTNKPQVNGHELTGNKTASDLGLASATDLAAHTGATNNPHGVTAAQVGAYAKPASGIPATDMAAAVQTALTNARTPTAHKSTHATGGTDALSPSDIGAAARSNPTLSGAVTIEGPGGSASTVLTAQGGQLIIGDKTASTIEDLPYKSSIPGVFVLGNRVVMYYKVEADTPLPIVLPELPAAAQTISDVVNLDLVIDTIGVTTLPTITINGATVGGAKQPIYASGAALPEIKANSINVIDATSIPALGAWVVMGATELTAVTQS